MSGKQAVEPQKAPGEAVPIEVVGTPPVIPDAVEGQIPPPAEAGPGTDIKPPAEGGATVEVPVQAQPQPTGRVEQPDEALVQAQAEIDVASGDNGEVVTGTAPGEPLKVVGDGARAAVDASLKGGGHERLEERVSAGDPDALIAEDPGEGEQIVKPTATQVPQPEVSAPTPALVAEPTPAAAPAGGVLAQLNESPQPQEPAPTMSPVAEPPAESVGPDQGPSIEADREALKQTGFDLEQKSSEELGKLFEETFRRIPDLQQDYNRLIAEGNMQEARDLKERIGNEMAFAQVLLNTAARKAYKEKRAEQIERGLATAGGAK